MTPLRLDPATARRFMRRALLLDEPAPDIATALAHHGYIQIDPINVCKPATDFRLCNVSKPESDNFARYLARASSASIR